MPANAYNASNFRRVHKGWDVDLVFVIDSILLQWKVLLGRYSDSK